MQYFQHMSRIGYLLRDYGFDLLIVLLAIAAMLQLVVRRTRRARRPRLSGSPCPRSRDGAPAVRAPALSLRGAGGVLAARRGALVRRRAAGPVPSTIFVAGMAAAFLLGSLRDARRRGSGWPSCSAGPRSSSTTLRPTRRATSSSSRSCSRSRWLAGFALRERAEQAEAAEERATQAEREREVGRPGRGGRGAGADRPRAARRRRPRGQRDGAPGRARSGTSCPTTLAEDEDALEDVEQTGRTALTEMRRLLGAMRERRRRRRARAAARARRPRRAARRGRRGPACRSSSTWTASRSPLPRGARPLGVPDRAGGADQRAQARAREPAPT